MSDATPPNAQVLQRDRVLLSLRRVFATHRPETLAAGRRLAKKLRGMVEQKHEEKRRGIRETLALLPIAKKMVLDPDAMNAPSKVFVDTQSCPPQLFQQPPVPVWMEEAFVALGRFSGGEEAVLQNLVQHLRNAQRGQIGEYKVKRRINLNRTSALDAYVFALSALWSQGEMTEAEVRRSLDPKRARNAYATPEGSLAGLTLELSRREHSEALSRSAWWDVAVMVALALDPDFNAKKAGLGLLPAWGDPTNDGDRGGMVRVWHGSNKAESVDRLWFWAERALLNLGQSDSRDITESEQLIAMMQMTVAAQRLSDAVETLKDLPPRRGGLGSESMSDGQIYPSSGPNSLPLNVVASQETGKNVPLTVLDARADRPGEFEEFNTLRFDELSRAVTWRENTCVFQGDYEWPLVRTLHARAPQRLSVQAILDLLWKSVKPTPNAVSSLVSRVRFKLKTAGFPVSLVTIGPRGFYRFVPPESAA